EAFSQRAREVVFETDQLVVERANPLQGSLLLLRCHRTRGNLLMRRGTDDDQLPDQSVGVGPELYRPLHERNPAEADKRGDQTRDVGGGVLALQKISCRPARIGRESFQLLARQVVADGYADIAEIAQIVGFVAPCYVALKVEHCVLLIL